MRHSWHWSVVILLIVAQTACVKFRLPGSHPTTPPPATTPAGGKELAKKKQAFLDDVGDAEKRLVRLQEDTRRKRAKSYNTTEAETVLEEIVEVIQKTKDLIYWAETAADLDAVALKLQEIKTREHKARNFIKHALLFGDKPKKDATPRKYLDDRDWVREALQIDPGRINKQTRGPFTVILNIFGATAAVRETRCWDGLMSSYRLETPPNVEMWTFPNLGRKVALFMETNAIVDRFMDRNELPAGERDQLLAQLCMAQTYGGGYRLIYFGNPVTDANSIMEQLFTGRGRVAGMFGMEGRERIAKATAALPDLAIASIAFSTALHPLNQLQQEQFAKFMGTMKAYDPELVSVLTLIKNIHEESNFAEIKEKLPEHSGDTLSMDSAKRQQAVLRLLDNGTRLIREGGAPEKIKEKIINDLWNLQKLEIKKRRDAILKIFRWQRTLNPGQQDIKELAGQFPPAEASVLKTNLEMFADTLKKLSKEFGVIQGNLRKYMAEYNEAVFTEGQTIAIFFLVDGARFAERALPGGQTVEVPDLALKITVEIRKGKKEPVAFLGNFDVKITTANQYIDEVRELRRLASFGIKFPQTLPKGNYSITFVVTDNLRAQSATTAMQWLVITPKPGAMQ